MNGAYSKAHRYEVWDSIVFGDIYTEEYGRYNTKAINLILDTLLDTVKAKGGQFSSAKHLWEKIQDLYEGQKHAGR